MSYTPTNWSDKTTPVDQSNLNKIEDALVDMDERIDSVSDAIINLGNVNTTDTLISAIGGADSGATYKIAAFAAGSNLRTILTREDTSNSLRGIIIRNAKDQNDYLVYTASTIYAGRMDDDGSIVSVRKFTGTSITA